MRTLKIKTFRPEISTVDIMIAKVSSCLLPGGGDGDDECEMMELQHCSLIILSYLHPSQIPPQSSQQTQTNLPIHLPARVGDNRTDGPSNHPPLLTTASPVRKQSECPGLSYCHTFNPCMQQSEWVQHNGITYQLWEVRTFTFAIITRVKWSNTT